MIGASNLANLGFTWTPPKQEFGIRVSTDIDGFPAQIQAYANNGVDIVIDWGDGSTATLPAGQIGTPYHTYSSNGTYIIEIRGSGKLWFDYNSDSRKQFKDVINWGTLFVPNQNIGGIFRDCINLTSTALDAADFDLSLCNNMGSAFEGCTNFNGNIADWDVTTIKYFSSMFSFADAFNQDLSGWDTSNAINMSYMFRGRFEHSFNQDISSWDTSNVTDMGSMFQKCIDFNQDLSGWDVSNVTSYGSFDNDANPNWLSSHKPNFI
jgi:surface protein